MMLIEAGAADDANLVAAAQALMELVDAIGHGGKASTT